MRRALAVLLPGALVLVGSAPAGEEPYDDRKTIDRALQAARHLGSLVPGPKSAASRSGDFRKGRLVEQLKVLRDVQSAARAALRWSGQPEEITGHRRAIISSVEKVVARAGTYGRSVGFFASAKVRLDALKRTKPNC